MQGYSLAHNSVQWICGVFLLGRPPDRVLKHTIELRVPNIGDWMVEPRGETYPSMIDLYLGYHQMRTRVHDSHRSTSRIHYNLLVIPLGLTNALVIFHSCRKWKRHLLLLFDAINIYNRTWEFHLSQLDETGGIASMSEVFHLDHLIYVQSVVGSQLSFFITS